MVWCQRQLIKGQAYQGIGHQTALFYACLSYYLEQAKELYASCFGQPIPNECWISPDTQWLATNWLCKRNTNELARAALLRSGKIEVGTIPVGLSRHRIVYKLNNHSIDEGKLEGFNFYPKLFDLVPDRWGCLLLSELLELGIETTEIKFLKSEFIRSGWGRRHLDIAVKSLVDHELIAIEMGYFRLNVLAKAHVDRLKKNRKTAEKFSKNDRYDALIETYNDIGRLDGLTKAVGCLVLNDKTVLTPIEKKQREKEQKWVLNMNLDIDSINTGDQHAQCT